MAKKTVASLQRKGAKAFTKAVKMIKNEKTGAYSYKTEIVPKDKVNDFFEKKQSKFTLEIIASFYI